MRLLDNKIRVKGCYLNNQLLGSIGPVDIWISLSTINRKKGKCPENQRLGSGGINNMLPVKGISLGCSIVARMCQSNQNVKQL